MIDDITPGESPELSQNPPESKEIFFGLHILSRQIRKNLPPLNQGIYCANFHEKNNTSKRA